MLFLGDNFAEDKFVSMDRIVLSGMRASIFAPLSMPWCLDDRFRIC
jgi:hypothetical protein